MLNFIDMFSKDVEKDEFEQACDNRSSSVVMNLSPRSPRSSPRSPTKLRWSGGSNRYKSSILKVFYYNNSVNIYRWNFD